MWGGEKCWKCVHVLFKFFVNLKVLQDMEYLFLILRQVNV